MMQCADPSGWAIIGHIYYPQYDYNRRENGQKVNTFLIQLGIDANYKISLFLGLIPKYKYRWFNVRRRAVEWLTGIIMLRC